MAMTLVELVMTGVCCGDIDTMRVVFPFEFVATTVNCSLCDVVGVPLTVAPLAVSHVGKFSNVIVGVGVPVAVAVYENALPTVVKTLLELVMTGILS